MSAGAGPGVPGYGTPDTPDTGTAPAPGTGSGRSGAAGDGGPDAAWAASCGAGRPCGAPDAAAARTGARLWPSRAASPTTAAASAIAAGAPSPASVRSAASPSAYPWPTARTFQAPWRRYSSRDTTAVSASRPVSRYPASSAPSGSATARYGAGIAPKRAGPPGGRTSTTRSCCTAGPTASRSTAKRCSPAAASGTASPGRAGAAGWASASGPVSRPSSSQAQTRASTAVPAETLISTLRWDRGWFCPRTSSAVILQPSPVALQPCRSVLFCSGLALVRCRSLTGAAGSPASGPGRSGRWPGCRGPSSASRRPRATPSP